MGIGQGREEKSRAAAYQESVASSGWVSSGPSGPQLVGQDCKSCEGRRHFALKCARKMCGVCCPKHPDGACAWHMQFASGAAP